MNIIVHLVDKELDSHRLGFSDDIRFNSVISSSGKRYKLKYNIQDI